MNTSAPRMPDETHRTLIVGRTGTGKSQAAIDTLSEMNWDEMPWIIIDYKGEDLVRDILAMNGWRRKNVRGRVVLNRTLNSPIVELGLEDKIPRKPGLYYLRPRPKLDDAAMEAWLMRVHSQGNTGLFIDEGYAMPSYGDSPAFTLLLTQGRTLHIPIIVLYQRPVWMSRFAVAQADFIRIFKQNDIRDTKTVNNYCAPAVTPSGQTISPKELVFLPDYYSLWHDVGRGITSVLKPASDRRTILRTFRERLTPHRRGALV